MSKWFLAAKKADFDRIANLIQRLNVDIAILTVPRESAQKIANYLCGAGIKYIWNFTPAVLKVPLLLTSSYQDDITECGVGKR